MKLFQHLEPSLMLLCLEHLHKLLLNADYSSFPYSETKQVLKKSYNNHSPVGLLEKLFICFHP